MKIKQLFLMLFLAFFVFNLSSCKKKNTTDINNNVNINTEINNNENLSPLEKAVKEFSLPNEITKNLEVIDTIIVDDETIDLYWDISDLSIIDYKGNVYRGDFDQKVQIVITFQASDKEIKKEYEITVLGFSIMEKLEKEMNNFILPSFLYSDYVLPNKCQNELITLSWQSNNEEIINNIGTVNLPNDLTEVILNLTLELENIELTKEFKIMTKALPEIKLNKTLNNIHDVNDFKDGLMDNLEIVDNYLVMTDNNATYISPIYLCDNFDTLVGSWSALADQNSGSVELSYHLRINGVWSDYVSYGVWSLGSHNKSMSSTTKDKLIKIDEDVVSVLKKQKADAYQYRINFIKEEDKLPVKLKIINTAINIEMEDSVKPNLPNYVYYDVPKLYQRDVPNIGGSICSPTSTTMLLKYYGHDFSGLGYQYEHEYMAWLVNDYDLMVFGNWTFNVAVMGALGEYAYVGLFSGVNDLMNVLANIGPVALSVKGNMQGYYTTAGHLLVCNGYKVEEGNVIFYCNDPNILGVSVEYTMETIQNVWRNYAYVIVR